MNLVFDACAMIALLRGESGSDALIGLLRNPGHQCYAHAINVCEVYYDFMRAADEQAARDAVVDLRSVGILISEVFDESLWRGAGAIKANVKRVSLADCFALAFSRRMSAELVTSDHHEFDPIAETGAFRIHFFR